MTEETNQITPEETTSTITFESLGLAEPLLRAIRDKGYDSPSPIQQQGIPPVLNGQDVMAAAQTGTGKTAGFTLPLLHRLSKGNPARANAVRALVLTPTRELAAQVADSVETYGKYLPLKSVVVFGGVKINPQMMAMRKGADVLVATPGRLLDLYNQNALHFRQLEVLILDEADRMLDMGFIRDIRKIIALLPKQRQTLMFSATFSDEIRTLAQGLLNEPVQVDVAPRNTTAETIKQTICPVDKGRKAALLSHLIQTNNWQQVLVFTRTKHGANKLVTVLEKEGIVAAAIHGNKSQGARTRALAGFKDGTVRVLVATDIAARGIDIAQLPQVVNYELPNVPEDYVHRIGRTGRAGADGHAVSLVSADEQPLLVDIEKLIKQILPREEFAGFKPQNPVAMTSEAQINKAPKKPKKPKVKATVETDDADNATVAAKPAYAKPKAQQPRRQQGQNNDSKQRDGKPAARQGTARGDHPQRVYQGKPRSAGSNNSQAVNNRGESAKPKSSGTMQLRRKSNATS